MKKSEIEKETIEAAMEYCGGKEGLALKLDRSSRSVELYLRSGIAPANIVREIRKMADRQRRKLEKE